MHLTKCGGVLLVILLAVPVTGRDDSGPDELLAELEAELETAWDELAEGRKPGTAEAEQKVAVDRYCRKVSGLARRALSLAETRPDAPEAVEALVWIHMGGLGAYSAKLDAECDEAYDLLTERYLDEDAILPLVRIAWANAGKSAHSEAFLRAAVERSTNPKVRALASFSLGRHQHQFVRLARCLEDPIRGEEVEAQLGPENARRIRAVNLEVVKREAEELYERTLHEAAELQPMGEHFPTLGAQAKGALYRLRNLEVGCTVPEIEGEDIDGQPLKLSDFRGKVVVISFWATWCGPCMGMVPDEIALVERMKGRPFVLIGVNGDEDREQAKSVSASEGITWRSFWDGGSHGPISTTWGVTSWPTVYLVDAEGIIRNESLRGDALDKAVEVLVSEAEGATR